MLNPLSSRKDYYETLFYHDAVMLMGTLVYGIRYTFPEYICTFLVAGGVAVFALLKVCKSSHPKALITAYL